MKPKEPTYRVVLDALSLTTCYHAFLITAEVPVIYMHQFWATVNKHKESYRFKINNKRSSLIHEDTQVYGAILPKSMTNQAMLDFVAYKTYYAIASGVAPPKSKKPKMKFDSAISFKETPSKKKPTKAKKYVHSKKKPASKPKPTKKKAPVKANRGKGLNVLLEVALFKAAQLKEATKQSKKDFNISQVSGSGDGTDFESGVPDEQQRKKFGANERTEEDDDTEDDEGNHDGDGNKDDNNDGDDNDDDDGDDNDGNDDDASDHERTKSDKDENPDLNQFNEEHEEKEENVVEFTDKEDDEENEKEPDDGQELFEQEEEDAHVTLTNVHDTQKIDGPMQSSSVSSNFTEKLLNFKKVSPADNEIASLMDTAVRTEEPSGQTSTLFTVPIIVILATIPPPSHFFNPLPQQKTPYPTPTASEVTTAFPALPDFAFVFRFNDRVINLERELSEMRQVDQKEAQAEKHEYIDLMDSSVRTIIRKEVNTQLPQILPKAFSDFATSSTYEAAASLSEYELTNILLDKMEERSDQGTKRRKYSKEAESQKYPRSKEGKLSSSSKDTSHSHHKSSGKSAHAEEPSHTVDNSGVQKNQEFDTGKNDEQPEDKVAPKNDWFKKPKRPLTPDPEWNKRQQVNFRPPQTWISVPACVEKPPTLFDGLTDTPIDFSAFVMNRLNITNLTQELLVGPVFNLLKGTCKSLTELEYRFEECSKTTTELA
ncbi:hypothetical protein Tco_1236975 [Tanacetum coccineum]